MIYKSKDTRMFGVPKWGAMLDGDKINFSSLHLKCKGAEFSVINKNGEHFLRKGKKLPLNFFTLFDTKIGILDDNDKPTNQSLISFRFHSSMAFCKLSRDKITKLYGAFHVRYFIYDGIDKTEKELIHWALNTNQTANDNITTIYKAKAIK